MDNLLDIPDWDYNWQYSYRPVETIELQSGDVLQFECTWERSRRDPNLEPAYVLWSYGSDDEMLLNCDHTTAGGRRWDLNPHSEEQEPKSCVCQFRHARMWVTGRELPALVHRHHAVIGSELKGELFRDNSGDIETLKLLIAHDGAHRARPKISIGIDVESGGEAVLDSRHPVADNTCSGCSTSVSGTYAAHQLAPLTAGSIISIPVPLNGVT